MTQTIALHGSTPEVNPLYLKLRRRFTRGDRTIGEVKLQEAIRDGFRPYETPVRRAVSVTHAAERHMSRANSLPTESKRGVKESGTRMSGSAVAILVICAFFLLFLLVFGAKISELNRELRDARTTATLRAEEKDLTVLVHGTNEGAVGADEEGEAIDRLYTANLLESFERN